MLSNSAKGPGATKSWGQEAKLDGGDDFRLGGEDGQARKAQLGPQEMAEGREDLVGFAGALNCLGEIQEPINSGGSLGESRAGGGLGADGRGQINCDAQSRHRH